MAENISKARRRMSLAASVGVVAMVSACGLPQQPSSPATESSEPSATTPTSAPTTTQPTTLPTIPWSDPYDGLVAAEDLEPLEAGDASVKVYLNALRGDGWTDEDTVLSTGTSLTYPWLGVGVAHNVPAEMEPVVFLHTTTDGTPRWSKLGERGELETRFNVDVFTSQFHFAPQFYGAAVATGCPVDAVAPGQCVTSVRSEILGVQTMMGTSSELPDFDSTRPSFHAEPSEEPIDLGAIVRAAVTTYDLACTAWQTGCELTEVLEDGETIPYWSWVSLNLKTTASTVFVNVQNDDGQGLDVTSRLKQWGGLDSDSNQTYTWQERLLSSPLPGHTVLTFTQGTGCGTAAAHVSDCEDGRDIATLSYTRQGYSGS